ncbi:tumor necrosis factor receptor superfamily member 5 isoform X2 [Eleginops maclovinus]|uniref:tumor necrosis factor receptor superfamily member 5 isoform X2 n=1 Tax=Eleginops maclovinus TaxID=56733 RepID=UPI003080066F
MLGAKMHLLLLILSLGFMGMTSAQQQCDPLTQYEDDRGICCKMCGPGTRMSSNTHCQDPQCEDCRENEYQDKYTKETQCLLQPYCDRNINFKIMTHKSKTERSICMCKEEFHCSSIQCMTCLPHTICNPGYGARYKGNHSQDTVCEKCPEGTFSNESSWKDACKKWTECESGYHIEKSGTDVSDILCDVNRRHNIMIGLIVVFLISAIIGVAMCIKGTRGDARGKGCFQSCFGEQKDPLRDTIVDITHPTQKEELLSVPEKAGAGAPEENEDQPSEENSTDVIFSDNGNFVTQDNGVSSKLSRQESQPHALIGEIQPLD